jgi:hypothetical protein
MPGAGHVSPVEGIILPVTFGPTVKHHTTIKLAPLPKLIKVYYLGFKVP